MSIDNEGEGLISRRTFLDGCSRLAMLASISSLVGASLVENVAADEGSAGKGLFAYGDEGRWPTENSFTIGFLYTERPDEHRLRIKELRKKHAYRRMFEYDSTDKSKVPFAIDVLNYFFVEPDLRFISKVAGEAKTSEQFHYKSIVDQLAPNKSKVFLTVKTNGRVGGGKNVREYLKKEVGRIGGITVVRRSEDDLMQIADFLTGNVAFNASRSQGSGASKNRVKTELLKTLQEHLKVASLLDGSLKSGKKFRVLHV